MESLVVRAKELAKLLSVSLVHIRRLDSAGKLPSAVRLGNCVSWRRGEIEEWLAAGSPNREKWIAIQTASKKGGK